MNDENIDITEYTAPTDCALRSIPTHKDVINALFAEDYELASKFIKMQWEVSLIKQMII